MKKISLSEATAAQLRDFAVVQLGLEIAATSNGTTIISKMRAAGFEADEIDVSESSAVSEATKSHSSDGALKKGYGMVTIYSSDDDEGDQPVFLSVNGAGIRVPRGKSVPLHRKFIEALLNAKKDRRDDKGNKIGEVLSYPFSLDEPVAQ